ncbi:hemerythrin HHE cation binding domain-containing protein [Motilibacter peucedani]|uniref:Hemerythrin HHE cation binding domain-containing protein n=1 Tax=Motilibacter peucedani TaxID=598650 RepID=A0A420XQP7_9ACTN|nr:hemerythrin domain-containing protein [Motilibacter peucedani]RKS75575.1 hemerythrin HHE cation binding domain-containing protein [Motilibacter peucedani]
MDNRTTDTAQTVHGHSSQCWWDVARADWTCPGQRPAVVTVRETEPALVDVRDMLVVHTAMLREFRLAPAAVARVPAGSRAAARAVERHLALLCDLLHHHHAGEDELLWPALRPRLPASAVALLDEAEAQHDGIDRTLARVGESRQAWVRRADAADRDLLVAALQDLHALLAEHLDAEERLLLPLAAAYLTEQEWRAIGEAGAGSVGKRDLPLVFGMFMYEGDPEVLAAMLSGAPRVPRMLVPRIAPRIYARRAAKVHGTRRP